MKNFTKKDIRRKRIRAKISGTAEVPRLNVFASNSHIYAQIINDVDGKTLVSASDTEKAFKANGKKSEIAKEVGKMVAKKATEKKIKKVVFDKGNKLYYGRVSALADGAREGGLDF